MKGWVAVRSPSGPTFDLKFFPCDYSSGFDELKGWVCNKAQNGVCCQGCGLDVCGGSLRKKTKDFREQ